MPILKYFYCTKYNEINIFYSDKKKYVSYTGLQKIFLKHYGLCLVMAANAFSIVFHGLVLGYYILIHFVMHYHDY